MNISRAVLMFYTFLLFLKLPSTVLNAHLTLIETLCGLDSIETTIHLDFTITSTTYSPITE